MSTQGRIIFVVGAAVALLAATATAQLAQEIGSLPVTMPYGHSFCADMGIEGQSPISIETMRADLIGPSEPLWHTWLQDPLDVDPTTQKTIVPGPVTVEMKNTTIQMSLPPNKYFLLINGVNYSAVQMHWHAPAEHAIDGELPLMELHVVHMDNSSRIAVVGFLFKLGDPSDLLQQMMDRVPRAHGMPYSVASQTFPGGLPLDTTEWTDMELAMASSYYIYNGS